MRQELRAGDKLFVDFAGDTLPIHDPKTGEIKQAQLFVAVLGASNFTYAEACPSQEMPHWTAAHVRAFEYFKVALRLSQTTAAGTASSSPGTTATASSCRRGAASQGTRSRSEG
ncbi:MAG TPA: hypothetical protein DIT15_05890 [Arthrobacter bacterium]|jgi:transposase|nr:hypothetical protein [Arthrobacter sp.]